MTVGLTGWLRGNLFSSVWSSITTLALSVVLAYGGYVLLHWVIVEADWTVITSRMPLYIVGRYPREFYWRPEVSLLLLATLIGMVWRMYGNTARTVAFGYALVTLLTAAFAVTFPLADRVLIAINPLLIGVGYFLASHPVIGKPKILIWSAIAWFAISIVLIVGVTKVWIIPIPGPEPVNTQDIGGLMLNLILATIGIVFSIPFGILLALGRRSELPVVKIVCVAFIEIIRGVPLITLLFMSRHILPLAFPESFKVDELYLAAITITIFSSAYMAENVRGGMAAVPAGQTEAAKALGLRGWQITALVTLPQGLRNIIPAIVGQSIGLFKDTSLVFIIGMLDLVEMGKSTITGNLEFVDAGREVYLFIAAVFWIFTFTMSYVSRKVERALGVGQR